MNCTRWSIPLNASGHILRKSFSPLDYDRGAQSHVLEAVSAAFIFRSFDEEFSRMEPETFVERVLVEKMRVKLVVVGFNYRFGYMGRGDAELLKKMGARLGFNAIVIPPVKVREEIVSSTIIRQHILKGRMEKVFELLGRHFSVPGKVITGKRVGRTLGFPTANMLRALSGHTGHWGVHHQNPVSGKWYNSVTNVGDAHGELGAW